MSLYALSDLLVFGLWKHQICDLTFQGRSHLFVCTVVFVVSILSEAPVSAHDVWFGFEYIVLNPQPGGPGQLYEIRLTKWCDQVGRSMVVVSQLRWASTSSFSLSDYILELKRDWHDNRHQSCELCPARMPTIPLPVFLLFDRINCEVCFFDSDRHITPMENLTCHFYSLQNHVAFAPLV